MTLIEPCDEVVLPSPYFVNHEMAVRALGAVPVAAPLSEDTGFALRLADLEPHITPRTRAVVLVSPNNPTGAVYAGAEIEEIGRAMLARGITVISDETYMNFVYGPARHHGLVSLPDWRKGILVCGSFSKSFAMTGWRVGYLIAPADVAVQALKIQDAMLICAPVIAQKAVLGAVKEAWDHTLQYLPALDDRRRYLKERIDGIPGLHWQPTEGGFFAFVRVDGCRDSDRLATELLDCIQVVTVPGSLFGRAGEGFLRLSYGVAEVPVLAQAFDRIAQFFSGVRDS